MLLTEFVEGYYPVIAGTGSRSFGADPRRDQIIEELIAYLREPQNATALVISGGATGWDAWVAWAALQARLPYVLCIPNRGYGDYYWRRAGIGDKWDEMCRRAAAIEYTMEEVYHTNGLHLDGLHSNFVRNNRMVELANEFVVYNPTSSGTRHCVRAIEAAEKPYRVFG